MVIINPQDISIHPYWPNDVQRSGWIHKPDFGAHVTHKPSGISVRVHTAKTLKQNVELAIDEIGRRLCIAQIDAGKPVIKRSVLKSRRGYWVCSGRRYSGYGKSPIEAYNSWADANLLPRVIYKDSTNAPN